MLLETIHSPADLRQLDKSQLPQLARELRDFVVKSVSQTGGHLSSNLGTIELTVALHYIYDTPNDRIVWDVGHQTYAHKILTGRREAMARLRMLGGISGFPRRWAWRRRPSCKANTAARSRSSAMAPCRPAWLSRP